MVKTFRNLNQITNNIKIASKIENIAEDNNYTTGSFASNTHLHSSKSERERK